MNLLNMFSYTFMVVFMYKSKLVIADKTVCEYNSTVEGYSDADALADDIMAHLSKFGKHIFNKPASEYKGETFIVCPNTTLIFSEETAYLPVFFPNTKIMCGLDGSSKNNCIFSGGNTHVTMSGDYVINATFTGLTFKSSTQASILAVASEESDATFIDCQWVENFGQVSVLNYLPPIHESGDDAMVLPTESPSSDAETATRLLQESRMPAEQSKNTSAPFPSQIPTSETPSIAPTNMPSLFPTISPTPLLTYQDWPYPKELSKGRPAMTLKIANSLFIANDNEQAVIATLSGHLSVIETEFRQNRGGVVIGSLFESFSRVDTSCFSNNRYFLQAPMFVEDNSTILMFHNYGHGNVGLVPAYSSRRNPCNGVFLQEGNKCLEDDPSNCSGTCAEFESGYCMLYPSPAPTGTPSQVPSAFDDSSSHIMLTGFHTIAYLAASIGIGMMVTVMM